MKQSKFSSLLWIVLFFVSVSVFATDIANPFSIQYINRTADSTYAVHMANGWGDSTQLSVLIWGQTMDISKYLSQNTMEITNFLKSNSDIAITKTSSTTSNSDSWAIVTPITEKSDVIKVRREDRIMLKQRITTGTTTWGKDITFIRFEKSISETSKTNNLTSISPIQKQYALNINWADFPLVTANGEYVDGQYYIENDDVVFPSSNLTSPSNIIKLKIDWVFSNYILLKKEIYKLSNPVSYQLKSIDNIAFLNLVFNNPYNATNVSNFDFYVNWAKIDKNKVTNYNGQFTINYLVSSIAPWSIITVYVADSSNNVSNTVSLNADDYIGLSIDKIELWDWKDSNFQFSIKGKNSSAFFWDLTKFTVNINWADYTYFWTQVALTDSGTTTPKTDHYWNVLYETKNKIDIRKESNGINFNFYYAQFGTGENIVYVKNDNIGRTSDKFSFKTWDYSTVNYNYWATTSTGTSVKWVENIVFEKSPEIPAKKIDFLYKPLENIPLGKLTLKNLDPKALYNVSFKIKTNLKIIPFSHITFNSVVLEPTIESDGTVSYLYNISNLWALFTSSDITCMLTDLFNISQNDTISKTMDYNIALAISDVSIKKYGSDQKFNEIFSNQNPSNINLGYRYEFGDCFDGGKDYCSLAKLVSPYLSLSLTYGAAGSLGNITTWQDSVVHINRPSDIPTLSFKTAKFNQYNALFKSFYENLKNKWLGASQLISVKKEIKIILASLKGIEDKTLAVKDANRNIRNSVLEIKRLLKK